MDGRVVGASGVNQANEILERSADDELGEADLTAQIDDAIDAVGQPGAESTTLRREANARLLEASDEW